MGRVLTLMLAVMVSGMLAGLVGSFVLNAVVQGASGGVGDPTSGLVTFTAVFSIVGLAAAAVFGLPAHMTLSRMGRTRRAPYVLAGLLAGLVMGLVFSGLRPDGWQTVLIGVAAGAAGGLGFWLIARPDRQPKL
jgi:hypothetical protein